MKDQLAYNADELHKLLDNEYQHSEEQPKEDAAPSRSQVAKKTKFKHSTLSEIEEALAESNLDWEPEDDNLVDEALISDSNVIYTLEYIDGTGEHVHVEFINPEARADFIDEFASTMDRIQLGTSPLMQVKVQAQDDSEGF